MGIQYQAWPHAVRSFGYFPPEIVVQVPMNVFVRMLDKAPEDKKPSWAKEAVDSGQENVLMQGRTFYGLVGDTVPQWMIDCVQKDK